ncbi:PQQ-binding-like beta-propeller repeat protein [Kitasatospora sp. MAP5-34]|uniref:outer membrane protein assembly factor BamB family protein n=1 Tax=Kitasatospora sp. MAP5-34 TaxID=3035102 RepID=UPI0024749AFA|nr:PQQ-binding-like beta-propeller repeat protein [Kitasatospora sp. MAP5-34]MDH6574506.1 outer membrane protein assembly factor BamB [Kitasatospora sp. MAP5-34]
MAVPGRRTDAVAAALVLLLAGCTSGNSGPVPAQAVTAARSATPSAAGDWPTYHRDPARTGVVSGLPAVRSLTRTWSAALDGAVYGQPLVVGSRVLAATENNTLYGLDAASGAVLWSRHLGPPARAAELPCGNIDPLGITGTPVYDPSGGLVYAVAELSGGRHELAGLDAGTGELVVRREVEPPKGDPLAHQQRAALALLDGRVVIAYGGLFGDCGDYTGSVLSVPATGAGPVLTYSVPTGREGGIWAAGGPVVDGGRLLVSVGNGAETSGTNQGSDSVLALTPQLVRTDFFAPASWQQDNADDLDLGSLSPVRVGRFVLTVGKRGTGYLLDAGHFGGVGGQLSQAALCPAYGGAAVSGGTVYLPCQDGLLQVTVGDDGSLRSGWRLPLHGAGSPVVGGGAVWVLDYGAGQLYALDPVGGQVLRQTSVGAVPRFASPVLTGGRVLVGTMAGVTAFGTG